MAFGVSISTGIHRNDSTVLPTIIAEGNDFLSRIKIAGWLYLPIYQEPYNHLTFVPPNRSLKEVPVVLRNLSYPVGNWELETDIVETADLGIKNEGTDGWKGAYFDTALSGEKCSIQATITENSVSTGISLQNSNVAINHDYNNVNVIHSIILGQNNLGSIREKGVLAKHKALFKYDVGDTPMIELSDDGSIVRYLLIKPNGEIKILRQTRSKLTATPKAEVLVYAEGSELKDTLIYSDNEVQTTFENIGVMHLNKFSNPLHWQRWGDTQTHTSTADVLELADKTTRATFPSHKEQLRSIGLRPISFDTEQYKAFLDFVKWHGNEKNFIFVDDARKIDGERIEYFAKMQGAFSDTPRNNCVLDHSQQIVEDYREEYIPKLIDIIAPNALLTYVGTSGAETGFIRVVGGATDNVKVVKVQLYKNGKTYGKPFQTDYADAFDISVPKSALGSGINSFYVIAYDYAGNSAQSNTGYFDNTQDITFNGETITFNSESVEFTG